MAQVFPGIHCVLYAMFDANERRDRAAMELQVAYVRAAGADGITVLGLATEVGKLSFDERCDVISWARNDAPDLPLSVTIAGNSVAEAIADGVNGTLVDFFDVAAWSATLTAALAEPERYAALRVAARETALQRYDLRRVCLPRMVAFVEGFAA